MRAVAAAEVRRAMLRIMVRGAAKIGGAHYNGIREQTIKVQR
jgi:hypothetical protein